MKKLAILTLLATPAAAHTVPFSDPQYLKISGGNPAAAQELKFFCDGSGRNASDCDADLGGIGNLKAEAARKCAEQALARSQPLFEGKGIDPRYSHRVEGVFHPNYQTGGDTGRSHRHYFTESDGQRAYEAKKRELYAAYGAATKDLRAEVTTTKTGGIDGKGTVGLPGVGSAEVGGHGSDTTVTANPILNDKDRSAIEQAAELARKYPERSGVDPTGLCFQGEKECMEGGKLVPNKSYSPEIEKEEKKSKEETGKKTSSNPPKAEDDHNHDVDLPEHHEVGKMAGDPTSNPDGGMWATPVLDRESLPASIMDNCMKQETKKLEVEVGSSTKDPEFNLREEAAQKAVDGMKNGYCDESYFGRGVCAQYNFQRDSVVAIDIAEDRKDNYNSAMSAFELTGVCDSHILDMNFCKKAAEKWTITPMDFVENEIVPAGRPSLILDGLKPIGGLPQRLDGVVPGINGTSPKQKPGDLSRVNP